jgi:asparagine synthase (glutamine-hydrolysing)
MCGLAGYIDWNRGADSNVLRAMETCIEHRGPDEGRTWTDGVCGLVHRRLRIIDLSAAAAQPMSNEDQSLWVVFNGEIYNFPELRAELLKLGHTFASHGDTEVLVHGFESWGTALFARLRGMFAVAFWEKRARRLTLVRDRLGKKPLFFAKTSGGLAFGSELPVFKNVPGLSLSLSRAAFAEYIEFGYVHAPRTILNEVQALRPAHYAVWSEAGSETQPYWQLPEKPIATSRREDTPEAAAIALDMPLRDAVACRLVSDVPLGCFLSGGIDSSLVAALAQQSLGTPLRTYTVGFSDSHMDEARHAARIARHLGTEHHELIIEAGRIAGEFIDILARLPEPSGDDSFVPTFAISRETKHHVTAALSGDGGDESFAGYAKYRQFQTAQQWQGPFPRAWRALASLPWPDRVKKSIEALSAENPCELARWLSTLWKRPELEVILAHADHTPEGDDFFSAAWQRRAGFGAIERFMLTDIETYLADDILPKVDRASMAVGLEVRSPFLDQRLMEAALSFPSRAGLQNGGKDVLKRILEKHVPRALFERPKQGFGIPIEKWFRGPLRSTLLEYTSPERIRRRGLLNPQVLTSYVNAHIDGRRNFARKLYAVLAFEVWADRFFGRS